MRLKAPAGSSETMSPPTVLAQYVKTPILALYMFIFGVLFLSATVRILCFVERFGMCLASVGHVNPHSSAAVYSFLQKTCVCFVKMYTHFMKTCVHRFCQTAPYDVWARERPRSA